MLTEIPEPLKDGAILILFGAFCWFTVRLISKIEQGIDKLEAATTACMERHGKTDGVISRMLYMNSAMQQQIKTLFSNQQRNTTNIENIQNHLRNRRL